MRLLVTVPAILLTITTVLAQPAPGPRMVAEWEPALGTLIRWPLGIPMDLVRELARDDVLYTLVGSSNSEQQARNAYAYAGIDLAQCKFIHGSLNSMWTRDWGPQAVFDDRGILAYADPWFDGYPWVPGCNLESAPIASARQDRGYEEDDALPAVVAAYLGVPSAPLAAYLTGGNIMTDGQGIAWSTEQMYDENAPHMSEATFFARIEALMGLDDYRFVIEPEGHGIQHIDCYAKLLDEETVLVKEVPAWHAEAACCDAVADAFATSLTCYGRPYRVLRIYCDTYSGSNAAAYTNSLILNRKVLVPTFGIASDQAALDTYAAAMPGYEVLGFPHGSWYDYDALHCRTMGIFDPGMLRLLHAPIDDFQPAGADVRVAAWIDDRSGTGLPAAEQRLHWRLAGETAWQDLSLTSTVADSFVAWIPAQAPGSVVEYRLTAADADGRSASLPRGTSPAAYSFSVNPLTAVPDAAPTIVIAAVPNPFNPRTELRVKGVGPSPATLTVFDLRGRRVKNLYNGPLPDGEVRIIWDGTDHDGRNVPSGVYLAVLRTTNETHTARLLLQR